MRKPSTVFLPAKYLQLSLVRVARSSRAWTRPEPARLWRGQRKAVNRGTRGGFVALLCIVLLSGLAIVALSMASETGLQLRISRNVVQAHQAGLNARTGMEYAIWLARSQHDFNDTPITRTFAGGSFTVRFYDEDGDLNDNPIDPVVITSLGESGSAARTLEAAAVAQPHPAVQYVALSMVEDVTLSEEVKVFGDVRSNRDIKKGSGLLAGVTGNMIVPSGRSVAPEFRDLDTTFLNSEGPLAAPSVDWSWYVAHGSLISPARDGDKYIMRKNVLSSTVNPWGPTNGNGIYWFDANNEEVILENFRLIATLVVLNASKVTVRQAAWQEPHRLANHQLPDPQAGDGAVRMWVYPGIQGDKDRQMQQDGTYRNSRTDPPDDDPDADSIAGITLYNANSSIRGDLRDHAHMSVHIPFSDDWYAWGRYYCPGLNFDPADPRDVNDPNSFKISISGGVVQSDFCNNVRDSEGRWGWRRWLWAGRSIQFGDPEPLHLGWLSGGEHTLTVYGNSNNPLAGGADNSPRLDVILLTNDPAYRPTDDDVPWLERDVAGCDGAEKFAPQATLLVQGELIYEIEDTMHEIQYSTDFDQDGTVAGSHPNIIRGVLYATKTLKVFNRDTNSTPVDFVGCIIGRTVEVRGRGTRVRHDPQLADYPIVGFHGSPNGRALKLIPGSVREIR